MGTSIVQTRTLRRKSSPVPENSWLPMPATASARSPRFARRVPNGGADTADGSNTVRLEYVPLPANWAMRVGCGRRVGKILSGPSGPVSSRTSRQRCRFDRTRHGPTGRGCTYLSGVATRQIQVGTRTLPSMLPASRDSGPDRAHRTARMQHPRRPDRRARASFGCSGWVHCSVGGWVGVR